MRGLREKLTLDALRDGIENSGLTDIFAVFPGEPRIAETKDDVKVPEAAIAFFKKAGSG